MIYIFWGPKNTLSSSHMVTLLGLKYLREQGFTKNVQLAKGHRGRPQLVNSQLHVSISYSDQFWVIGFSKAEIGIDIESYSSSVIAKLKGSKFKARLKKWVEVSGGALPFEEIQLLEYWTGYEAEQKLMGTGIFGKRPPFAVSNHNFWLSDCHLTVSSKKPLPLQFCGPIEFK